MLYIHFGLIGAVLLMGRYVAVDGCEMKILILLKSEISLSLFILISFAWNFNCIHYSDFDSELKCSYMYTTSHTYIRRKMNGLFVLDMKRKGHEKRRWGLCRQVDRDLVWFMS